MTKLKINTHPEVKKKFNAYPKHVKNKMNQLRKLILEAAQNHDGVLEIEETLKWNEPSFIAKKGSTIRIDWKEKHPDQYAVYFKCTSKLVPSFKAVYGDLFKYENNRAIVFQLDDVLPENELKKCISAALTYHHIKHLPHLGLS